MMRGRKPKPLAQAILEGYQKSRTNFAQPSLPMDIGEAPDLIRDDPDALTHWNELAPILRSAGLLTIGDRAALAQLCEDYAIIKRAHNPETLKSMIKNSRAARSFFAHVDKAKDRYRRMLTEFGLTPSSRSRIRATGEPPKDNLALFLEEQK
jgi:P27 family predicted phage terminase small subunit